MKEAGDAPTMYGVRTADAKLIRYPGHNEWTEVFSLNADPYEVNNLAAYPARVSGLASELDSQIKAMKYEIPAGANARLREKTK